MNFDVESESFFFNAIHGLISEGNKVEHILAFVSHGLFVIMKRLNCIKIYRIAELK
jgi:hypothetical protein